MRARGSPGGGSPPQRADAPADPEAVASDADHVVVLFDGVCNLCSGIVAFIIRRDAASRFRFAPLQSPTGRELLERFGLPQGEPESVVVIHGGRAYTRSAAALEIARRLGWPWRALYPLRIVPRPLRDLLYDAVARSRYRVWGRKAECIVPTPDVRARFLDW